MIHVIVGPPCAGKSSYVLDHMKAGDVRLDFDLLIDAVKAPDAGRYDKSVAHTLAFACRESVIRNVTGSLWRHSSAGADAWMIHTTLDADTLTAYQSAGAHFLKIDPGIDECIARAHQRDGDAADHTIQVIQSWYAAPPSLPEGMETMKHNSQALRTVTAKLRLLDATADTEDTPGAFKALVSVFNVRDSQGGVILPGAFKASLEARGDKPFPFMWSHKWDDIAAVLGSFTGEETDEGLVIDGQIDLDSPQGPQAYRLMQRGLITEFSIGGFVPMDGFELRKDEDGDLTEYDSIFDLREVSLCLAGANPDTQLLDLKAERPGGEEDPPPTPQPSPPDPDGDHTKATDAPASGGLTHSRAAKAAVLAAVVEAIGQKEVSS